MNIALIQPNVTGGDFLGNAQKILSFCQDAHKNSCELAIAPAEAVSGLPLPNFFSGCQQDLREAISFLASSLPQELALLCALPQNGWQHILIQNNLACNLDSEFRLNGRTFYLADKMAGRYCDIGQMDWIINTISQAWHCDESTTTNPKLAKLARTYAATILSANLVGGYDNLVFAGASAVYDCAGEIISRAAPFREDLLVYDTEQQKSLENTPCDKLSDLWQALTLGVRDFYAKRGWPKAIIGLSGGMDSALAACVAREALGGENVLAILMPSPYTSAESIRDAEELVKNLQISIYKLPIDSLMHEFSTSLNDVFNDFSPQKDDLTLENIQARIRGVLLMAIANRAGGLVLNTSNRSESLMGYCTLYGDSIGALSVIGDLYKTQVYEIAEWYCKFKGYPVIPENIFQRPPSAELRPDQKDIDSLPPYPELDACLAYLLDGKKLPSSKEYERMPEIMQKIRSAAFKRQYYPPALLVGPGHENELNL